MENAVEFTFDFPGVRKCLVEFNARTASLVLLIVEPAYRRRAVGTHALAKLAEFARGEGCRELVVFPWPAGPEGEQIPTDEIIRFYRRNGFSHMGGSEMMIKKL